MNEGNDNQKKKLLIIIHIYIEFGVKTTVLNNIHSKKSDSPFLSKK